MGEWHTRAQVSMLLLPNAARTIFWTTYTSSLVQRLEEMPPIAPTPCSAWIAWKPSATLAIASSHETVAPLVVDRVAHHRGQLAVLVGGVAVGEAALHAAVALVGAAVLRRDHPHDLGSAPSPLTSARNEQPTPQ